MSGSYSKSKRQLILFKPFDCLTGVMLVGWMLIVDLQAGSPSLKPTGLLFDLPITSTACPDQDNAIRQDSKSSLVQEGYQTDQQADPQDNQLAGQQDNQLAGQQDNQLAGQQDNQLAGQQDNQLAGQQDASQFDGEAAFGYLERICAIGRRVSASKGMEQQIEFLTDHFTQLGGQVEQQKFKARDPSTGKMVELTNLIVRWNPDQNERLLLCCHYDTRPFPDSDPINPRGLFIGANDGASGVAALCELGKHIEGLGDRYGIDFVFFDAEEFVFLHGRDPMFLGSTHFAQQYRKRKRKWKYLYGILLDMVGDADLQIYMEGNSLKYCPRLTRSIWTVAQQLGVKEFIPELRHTIRDDHLPLNEIARIETCNIIDFDYPNPQLGNIYWHTEKDIPENCSADSLGKVGRVVLEWLRQFTQLNRVK